jgi:hypothetical protein
LHRDTVEQSAIVADDYILAQPAAGVGRYIWFRKRPHGVSAKWASSRLDAHDHPGGRPRSGRDSSARRHRANGGSIQKITSIENGKSFATEHSDDTADGE